MVRLSRRLEKITLENLMAQYNDINQAFIYLKTIRGIGDKIASFYLRNLVVVLNLNLINIQNRLNQSLHSINMTQPLTLINDFRSRINNVCQNC